MLGEKTCSPNTSFSDSPADGKIDKAMRASLYKATSHAVKTFYTNKLVPAQKTCMAFKKKCIEQYHQGLLSADALVDQYLPGTAAKDKVNPALLVKRKGATGLVNKFCKRARAHVIGTLFLRAIHVQYVTEE